LPNHNTFNGVIALLCAVCGVSTLTQASAIAGQWGPTIEVDWWISGSGNGTLTLLTEQIDEDHWQSIGVVGDSWRVLTWSVMIDLSSGRPQLDVQSLIAKNYTPNDAQFALTIDLDLTEQLLPNTQLLGDLSITLAGTNGAAWVPQDDQWLWQLRADGDDKGGIFTNPWRLEVEQGAVTAFGGLDLPAIAAPTSSVGFGLSLMLTAGEGAYMNGFVAVPGAPTGILIMLTGCAPRRRRRSN
jgi:hypothetical protein